MTFLCSSLIFFEEHTLKTQCLLGVLSADDLLWGFQLDYVQSRSVLLVLPCHSAGVRSRDKGLSYRVIWVRSDIETSSEYETCWPEAGFWDVIGTKVEFSSLLFTVTSTNGFYSSPSFCKSGSKLVYNVYFVMWTYGKLKSENSQHYAQKAQRNFMFMNSASGKGTVQDWTLFSDLFVLNVYKICIPAIA